MNERKPLARAEKYRARTVKMPDSLWREFTAAALAEGEQNISTFIRACAITGLEHRRLNQAFGAYRGRPGMPGNPNGSTYGRTAG